MTALWIPVVALCVSSVWVLVLPLMRQRRTESEDRATYDLRIAEDQLAEIARDHEQGVIDADQAETARLEIKRRMLEALQSAEPSDPSAPLTTGWGAKMVAIGLAVAIPVGAGALYLGLGSPHAPDQPFAARATAVAESGGGDPREVTMEAAVAQLAERMAERPDDAEGWILLGRSYLTLGQFENAVGALRRGYDLLGEPPRLAADVGEAMVLAGRGRVSAEARALFEHAGDSNAGDPRPLYYLSLAEAQAGNVQAALEGWTTLAAASPADAPWLPGVRQRIADAAAEIGIEPPPVDPAPAVSPDPPATASTPGPTQEQMDAAAEMTPAERQAMIEDMVDRLAARLAENPDDAEGWRRLARAYDVLGETEKAEEARARAEAVN